MLPDRHDGTVGEDTRILITRISHLAMRHRPRFVPAWFFVFWFDICASVAIGILMYGIHLTFRFDFYQLLFFQGHLRMTECPTTVSEKSQAVYPPSIAIASQGAAHPDG